MGNTKPTCQIKFTQLEFGNQCYGDNVASYRQFHCRVIIDSRMYSQIDESKPERSPCSEKETLARLGIAWWGFDVHDPYLQKGGTYLEETEHPTATFTFFAGAINNHIRVPKMIDVEVTSYWSVIPSLTATSNVGWLSKIITANSSSVTQYSHLCQMTALSIPTDLKQDSHHSTILFIDTTGAGLHVKTKNLHPESRSVKINFSQMTRRMDSTPFDYGKLLPFMISDVLRRIFFSECANEFLGTPDV